MDWSRGSNYIIKTQSQSLSFSISLSLSFSLIFSLPISHLSYKKLELVLSSQWLSGIPQTEFLLKGEESHRILRSCFCVLSMQWYIWFWSLNLLIFLFIFLNNIWKNNILFKIYYIKYSLLEWIKVKCL